MKINKIWNEGITYETNFWDSWFKSKGREWQEDYKKRLKKSIFPDNLAALLQKSFPSKKIYQVLDVGSGPLTTIGTEIKDHIVELKAVDPLANIYQKMYKKYKITPPTITSLGYVEKLTSIFKPNSFDLIHMSNSLDHSYDPIKGIKEMLAILRPGGYIYLSHRVNEAEFENYQGFHQWNLTSEDNDFVIWNKRNKHLINSNKYITSFTSQILVNQNNDSLVVIITKKTGILSKLRSFVYLLAKI